uniref:Uncharacterized protein n=1 Tax=Oryza brachyantha TaxID=4533 RepID=J3KZV5_ORYBR
MPTRRCGRQAIGGVDSPQSLAAFGAWAPQRCSMACGTVRGPRWCVRTPSPGVGYIIASPWVRSCGVSRPGRGVATHSSVSDASSAKPSEDDIGILADAITKTATKSPEAVRAGARAAATRLSPATIATHIDWDIVLQPGARKMATPMHWTDIELQCFLRACLEETGTENLDTTNPNPAACDNIARRLKRCVRNSCNPTASAHILGEPDPLT